MLMCLEKRKRQLPSSRHGKTTMENRSLKTGNKEEIPGRAVFFSFFFPLLITILQSAELRVNERPPHVSVNHGRYRALRPVRRYNIRNAVPIGEIDIRVCCFGRKESARRGFEKKDQSSTHTKIEKSLSKTVVGCFIWFPEHALNSACIVLKTLNLCTYENAE